ncbi:MAG: STAS domain-containing protein [Geodermatophilaceae bacterium]
MSFAVERTSRPDGTCVAVAGEVDIDTAPRMSRALAAGLAAGRPVVVDLGAVTFMDSAGLSALIAAHKAAAAAGLTCRLQDLPPAVRRLLEVTGMDSLLVVMPPADRLPADSG